MNRIVKRIVYYDSENSYSDWWGNKYDHQDNSEKRKGK